eukprot:TRINITY_DN1703_c0_g2_i2.p1 TRINITY_DN1703_c0_g2~~TRINITY_DN1703_c0_g2_i2.p1  ORF type:complete len:105 (-),score=17.56 TRINITY_DN1703_c0_g2_i2:80-394(-)
MVRFKNRYFLLEFQWEDVARDTSLTSSDVYSTVRECVQTNYGDYGVGLMLTSLNVKYVNPLTNLCIVRVARSVLEIVNAVLPLVTVMKKRRVRFHMLHIGGMYV